MAPLMRMRLRDIGDPSNEIARQRTLANADTAQGLGPMSGEAIGPNAAFNRAMRRAKGLTRVAMMGEDAARMQAIRDRGTVANFGQNLQRGQTASLSGLASSQALTDAARMQAQQIENAGMANFVGTVGGALASYGGKALKGYMSRPVPAGGTGAGMGAYTPENPLNMVGQEGLVMYG